MKNLNELKYSRAVLSCLVNVSYHLLGGDFAVSKHDGDRRCIEAEDAQIDKRREEEEPGHRAVRVRQLLVFLSNCCGAGDVPGHAEVERLFQLYHVVVEDGDPYLAVLKLRHVGQDEVEVVEVQLKDEEAALGLLIKDV